MGILGKILKSKKTDDVKSTSVKVSDDKTEAVVEKKLESKPKKLHKRTDVNAYRKICYPLISEKATQLATLNKYVFVVPVKVNKAEVVKTIKNIYGVNPVKVNSIKSEGKFVRTGRLKGKKSDFKKVIVTLAAGEKIEIYEGV